jgi:hypothetical protein
VASARHVGRPTWVELAQWGRTPAASQEIVHDP